MKKIAILSCALLSLLIVNAQQKEGRVIYQRDAQMQVRFSEAAGSNPEIQRMIPKSRTDKFELTFANNQSIWKQAEQEAEPESLNEGGMQIVVRMAGSDDVVYFNFDKSKRVDQRDVMDKKFVVEDSIRPLKWKMTGETKTILNHKCMKAVATQIVNRPMTNIENGKTIRTEVIDTSLVTAWFATDIPVAAGPAEYQGQLPGLILEMDINNGRMVFKALEITPKADIASIKEPTAKKKYTPEEYRKERDKIFEEMQKNNGGGGNRIIRF